MNNDVLLVLCIAVFVLFSIARCVNWILETLSNSKNYLELKPKLDQLENSIKEHALKVEQDREEWRKRAKEWNKECELREEQWNKKIQRDRDEIQKIAKQKSMGFPWLAQAYADYFTLIDLKREKYLENKKHPALSAAATVSEIKNEKHLLLKENKILHYKISYFEKLFPWLSELIAENEDEEIPVNVGEDSSTTDEQDRVKNYLTPEEYQELPSAERNQKALDRYLRNRNKSKWAIGRDYEMYVGYLYDQKGYSIEYKGIIDGFDDLGRDIIAKNNDEVCIIQCKYWAHYKEIHEKHIFQLFGTTMEYWLKNIRPNRKTESFEEFSHFLETKKLRPIFFTSTSLSDKAREMASALNVEIEENKPIGDFPRIKCNTNYDENGNQAKIYHLPMDQQYDRTIITKSKGEFYAFTVQEAEDAGFRRAFRHRH